MRHRLKLPLGTGICTDGNLRKREERIFYIYPLTKLSLARNLLKLVQWASDFHLLILHLCWIFAFLVEKYEQRIENFLERLVAEAHLMRNSVSEDILLGSRPTYHAAHRKE